MAAHPPAPTAVPPTPAPERTLRLLLIEDDDGDALLVREMLHDALPEAVVERARTLGEAEALLRRGFDCALADLGLPDSEGTGLVARLLHAAPQLAVVVLTGADSERTGTEAVAAGAQDYLVKTKVDEQVLARSVRYAVERRRAQDAARRLHAAEILQAEKLRVERALLPAPLVSSSGLRVTVRYQPGRDGAQLGGDFYDAVELADGSAHLTIGDVSGHGPDEAALAVRLRSAWRALTLADLDPLAVVALLDRFHRAETDTLTTFATMCSVHIPADQRSATVILAGHPAPLLLEEPGGALGDGVWGPLLGIVDDPEWEAVEVALPPRWAILLFTDGVFEGRDPDGGRLGEEQVMALARRLWADGVRGQALLEALVRHAEDRNGGPLPDDVALSLVEGEHRG
jgi:serine phosphatase RsbU (regulator of sigma subunit)